jgi:hypothetical protein
LHVPPQNLRPTHQSGFSRQGRSDFETPHIHNDIDKAALISVNSRHNQHSMRHSRVENTNNSFV